MKNRKIAVAFTLSEVLITLVIIGVIAAITVPSVINSINNQEYKVGYKKAYSDLSRAALKGIAFGEFPLREKKFDSETTNEEWAELKEQFRVERLCENNDAFDCWVDDDRLCIGCAYENNVGVPNKSTKTFVDLSGRAWALYDSSENIFLVDINGDKGPNHFGKDRWGFTFADKDGNRICSQGSTSDDGTVCTNPSLPYKVTNYPKSDYTSYSKIACQHPPCRYFSWLYE